MQNEDPSHRIAASIPFHLLFREIPKEKSSPSAGRDGGDMVTTFQINSRPRDGTITVAQNDQVCKKYQIDGKKDVVLKVTLGMSEGGTTKKLSK